jgi:hypothetical protein
MDTLTGLYRDIRKAQDDADMRAVTLARLAECKPQDEHSARFRVMADDEYAQSRILSAFADRLAVLIG